MQSFERGQWQQELSSTIRAILSEPQAQTSPGRERDFEAWRRRMSAELGIAVEDRDFSAEEINRSRPLAQVIRDAQDVKLVEKRLNELRLAMNKPGKYFLAPGRWKQKPNERPGTALENKPTVEPKRYLFPEYEASSIIKELAGQHKRRRQYQAIIRQKHQREMETARFAGNQEQMQYSLLAEHVSQRKRLIYQM